MDEKKSKNGEDSKDRINQLLSMKIVKLISRKL